MSRKREGRYYRLHADRHDSEYREKTSKKFHIFYEVWIDILYEKIYNEINKSDDCVAVGFKVVEEC